MQGLHFSYLFLYSEFLNYVFMQDSLFVLYVLCECVGWCECYGVFRWRLNTLVVELIIVVVMTELLVRYEFLENCCLFVVR